MGAMTETLTLTELSGADWRNWRIEEPLTYDDVNGSVTVPKGFVTDGASVPRALWMFVPSWGRYSRAAVVHDYLLVRIESGTPHPLAMTRKDADFVFKRAMENCGVNRGRRWFMFLAVRAYGIVTGKAKI